MRRAFGDAMSRPPLGATTAVWSGAAARPDGGTVAAPGLGNMPVGAAGGCSPSARTQPMTTPQS